MELNFDLGFECDARHGPDQSSLFEFSFELDVDAMEAAGLGHHAMFCFVVDFSTGHAVRLTSDSSAEVIAAAQIYPPYLEDAAGMGTELVAKFSETTGAGDTIYECLSFEYSEPMDKEFLACQDEIGGAFFGICQRVLDFVKKS